MNDFITPCSDDNVVTKYIQKFINVKEYRDCAIKNPSSRVYASDFLIESNKETFTDVFNRVSLKSNNNFYVIWMLSTVYKETFPNTVNLGRVSKDNLMQLLMKQKEEMNKDCLVYIKDLSLTDFWDLMIFDETFSWTCVLTHEDDIDGKRICYYVEL